MAVSEFKATRGEAVALWPTHRSEQHHAGGGGRPYVEKLKQSGSRTGGWRAAGLRASGRVRQTLLYTPASG